MNDLPKQIKEEVVDFIIDLQGGIIDDERWDFNVESCDWEAYKESFLDSMHLRTTLSVWLNHLKMDALGNVTNTQNARYRAAQ